MIRALTFILALLLALPPLAHSFDSVKCNSSAVESTLGSDTKPLGEDTRSKNSAHCQMYCAIFSEMIVPTVAPGAQEHDIEFKPVLLFDIGYVVPRPPDAHA